MFWENKNPTQDVGKKTPQTQTFGGPRGFLGSALDPPGGAPGAAPGALRAPGRGAWRRSRKSARTSESFRGFKDVVLRDVALRIKGAACGNF